MPLDAGVAGVNLAKRAAHAMGLNKDPSYMELPSKTNDTGLTNLGIPAPQTPGESMLTTAAGALAGSRIPQLGSVPVAEGQPLQTAGKTMLPNQTVGQITGNPFVQAAESTLARGPGGGPIRTAITAQKQNLETGVQDMVDGLAGGKGTTSFNVGSAVDAGISQGAKDLKDIGGAMYDGVDSAMKDAQVTPMLTQKVLETVAGVIKGAKNLSTGSLSDATLQGVASDLKKDLDENVGFIPYDALKAVMTRLGNKIDWTGLSSNESNGAMKQVYLAMRQDLNATAETYGQGAAVKAANKNWGDVKDRLDALNSAVSGNGGPEQIFNRLVSGAKLGPSGLSTVMDVLSDSNQKLLAAGVLQRLGRSTADSAEFDADTFFRNWGKMDPDAKNRLFGSLPQEYSKNLDKLFNNAKVLKAYSQVLPNASNTASAAIWGGSMTAALTAVLHGDLKTAGIAAVGVPAMTNILSRALTNPRVVRYLAQKTEPAKVLGLSGAVMGATQPPPASKNQTPLWMQIPGQQ